MHISIQTNKKIPILRYSNLKSVLFKKDLVLTKVTKHSAKIFEKTTPKKPIVGNNIKLATILMMAPTITDLLYSLTCPIGIKYCLEIDIPNGIITIRAEK